MSPAEASTAIQTGDRAGLDAVYREHGDKVLGRAYQLTRDTADAEDAAQEAWVRVLVSGHTFRAESAPASWLHQVVSRTALMSLRGHRTEAARRERAADQVEHGEAPAWAAVPDHARDPGVLLDESRLAARIRRALEALPPVYREPLRAWADRGPADDLYTIAERLGLSRQALKSRLHRGRAALRALLEADRDG